jgi:membrane-associated phospholipid phosphatase
MVIGVLLLIYGKKGSFILINGYYTTGMDHFFQYATYLGDGLIYIPVVAYCAFWNRRFLVPALTAILFCTLISQGLKRFVFEDQLRPISLELENIIIHKIKGVPLNRMHSFPSGHTSTAFTMSLLLCAIMRNRVLAFVLPFIALLVGYSRIYLAQHFLTDVCAGIAIGIISSFFALWIYHAYITRKNREEVTTG